MEGAQEMTQVVSTFLNVGGQMIPFTLKTTLDLSEKILKLLAILGSKSFGLGKKAVKGVVKIKTEHKIKEFKLKRKGLVSIEKLKATKGEDLGFVRLPEDKVEEYIDAVKKRGGKISLLEDLNPKDGKVEFAYHVSDASKIESALAHIKAGEFITKEEYLNNADEKVVNRKFEEAKNFELKNVESPVKSNDKSKTKYFSGYRSEQELTQRFRALVKIYHPEQGSNDVTQYQEIVEQYKRAKEKHVMKKDSNVRIVIVPNDVLKNFLAAADEKGIRVSIMQGGEQKDTSEVELSYQKADIEKVESIYNELVPEIKKTDMGFDKTDEKSTTEREKENNKQSESAKQFERNNKKAKDTKSHAFITINVDKLVVDKKEDVIYTKIPGTNGQQYINFSASDVSSIDDGKTLAIKLDKNKTYEVMNRKGEVVDRKSGSSIKIHYDDVNRNLKKAAAINKAQKINPKVKMNPKK